MSVSVGEIIKDEKERLENIKDESERKEARYKLEMEETYFEKHGILKDFNLISKQ